MCFFPPWVVVHFFYNIIKKNVLLDDIVKTRFTKLAPTRWSYSAGLVETTTENRTSDTETVQSETGQNGHAGHDATETNQKVDLHQGSPNFFL